MNTLFLNAPISVLKPANAVANVWNFGVSVGKCMEQKVRWLEDS
ncbi:MAG: hypothetical protein U0X91_04715 [Spirosomataceae bacterium]